MGGSDDPSNLIDLTVEEHAEAHKKLYQEYGNQEDWLAWKGLSGQIGKEEYIRELQLFALRKGGHTTGTIQGKKNVENGHIYTISNFETCSLGGKKATEDKVRWKSIAIMGGKASSIKNLASGQIKSLSRKVISKEDGKIISWNNKHHHEKKTGYKHTWIEYED